MVLYECTYILVTCMSVFSVLPGILFIFTWHMFCKVFLVKFIFSIHINVLLFLSVFKQRHNWKSQPLFFLGFLDFIGCHDVSVWTCVCTLFGFQVALFFNCLLPYTLSLHLPLQFCPAPFVSSVLLQSPFPASLPCTPVLDSLV